MSSATVTFANSPLLVPNALGLFGGTFDPVHNAHLALARAALAQLHLAAIRWIPSGQPGHRARPGASIAHRLAMLHLALAGEARFALDEADARAGQATYTINTLTRLREELGAQKPLVFIIGADQFVALNSWREWRRLFDLAHFAVAQRPGYDIESARLPAEVSAELASREAAEIDMRRPAGSIVHFDMPSSGISASAIREALTAGRDAGGDLPAPVLDYIRQHHLYSDSGI